MTLVCLLLLRTNSVCVSFVVPLACWSFIPERLTNAALTQRRIIEGAFTKAAEQIPLVNLSTILSVYLPHSLFSIRLVLLAVLELRVLIIYEKSIVVKTGEVLGGVLGISIPLLEVTDVLVWRRTYACRSLLWSLKKCLISCRRLKQRHLLI